MNSKQPQLRVYMPAYLFEAIERAARRQLSNPSVYTRQALLARLIQDGDLSKGAADQSLKHQPSADGMRA